MIGSDVPFCLKGGNCTATGRGECVRRNPLHIAREMLVPVRLSLLARPGTELGSIRVVASHPHATAQCRHWLRTHLPEELTAFLSRLESV